MTESAPLRFFFDFVSPYGYFAACRIEDIARRHGRTVEWHPILIGVIVTKVMGLKPLLETPLKRDYVRHDVPRMAARIGVPFRTPDHGQPNPLNAARASLFALEGDTERGRKLIMRLMRLQWVENVDISSSAIVADAAVEVGLCRKDVGDAIKSARIKELLAAKVEEAVELGVFGSPFILAGTEPFWGSDRLEMLSDYLACSPEEPETSG